jgi:glycosyltransferase involved in cell wall biosynthesis
MVDVYTVAWNEADIIEWCLAHYSTFADRIFVFDGGSVDGTRDIVRSCDRATLLDLDSGGVLRDDLHTEVKNTAWQGKDSDWVICVDADEFLFSPKRDVGSIITGLDLAAIAVPRVMGVNMFGEVLPRFQGGGQLYDHVTLGVRDDGYSKCALFKRAGSIGSITGSGVMSATLPCMGRK